MVAIRLLKTYAVTLSVSPRLKPNCVIISKRVGSGPVPMATIVRFLFILREELTLRFAFCLTPLPLYVPYNIQVIMLTESMSSSTATPHSSSWNARGKSSTPSVISPSHAQLGCPPALVLLAVGADQVSRKICHLSLTQQNIVLT